MELSVLLAGLLWGVGNFGLGYYVGQRGWKGVQNDIENIKKDFEELKARLNS